MGAAKLGALGVDTPLARWPPEATGRLNVVPMQNEESPGPIGRRLEVLRVLKAATTPLSVVQIADQLAVHPNTVRFHLDRLIENRQAEPVPPARGRPGRPPHLFRAVRRMDPTGPRHYRLLAEVLTHSLAHGPHPGARAIEAGRAWGRRLAPVTADGSGAAGKEESVQQLVSLLDDLSFAPERQDAEGQAVQVGLRHCPFLELAETRAQIVCPVHLGLMQGAMDAWGAPLTVDRLEAFVEPDLCLAHLAPTRAVR
jgi:predicted ArsR family transcriptional regulator